MASHAFFHTFLQNVAVLYPAFLLLFTISGFFRATASYAMGDRVPYHLGYVSINPLAHVDPVGLLIFSSIFACILIGSALSFMLGIMLWFFIPMFGIFPWRIVPVNPLNFRHPRLGTIITTVAGPVGLFLASFAGMLLIEALRYWVQSRRVFLTIAQIGGTFIGYGILWGILMLIPIPPFQGSALIPAIFGRKGQQFVDALEPYGLFILLGMFFFLSWWWR